MGNFKKINGNFVTTSAQVAQDKRLSWKARGIFLYLASMSDGWNFYVDEIAKHAPQGKRSLQSGLKELEEYGYLKRVRTHKPNGDLSSLKWELHYEPVELQKQKSSEAVLLQKRNEPLINNNNNKYQETININNNKRNIKESQASLTDRFEKLWKQYPKKQGKKVAFEAYKRAIKKGVQDKDIELGITNYNKYIKITKKDYQYIKQGSTWFNQNCWDDEYNYGNQPKKNTLPKEWEGYYNENGGTEAW